MNGPGSRLRMQPLSRDASATPLELFFDLVFVFALTQVTGLMSHDLEKLGGEALLRGVLLLGLLWWSWVGYAWLANVVKADEGPVRAVLIAAMAVMFVLALTIPEAFEDLPGGLPGPVVIAVCYFVFRMLHLLMFWIISREDPGLRNQVLKFTPSVLGGTILLLVASQRDGWEQTLFWVLALLADYGGTFLGGARGWRLRSPGHFAERHGLILIVALGESIVAIGVGVAELPISWPIVGAAILALLLSAALWWAYFDISSLQAERALSDEPEATLARVARDAYSFLHFPLVGSVVMVALGFEEVLKYVGDEHHHDLGDPLADLVVYAFYGGLVAYLLSQVAFKLRVVHVVTVDRIVAAVVLLLLIPVALRIPAIAALAVAVVVMTTALTWETVVHAEHRRHIRHELAGHHG